MSGMLQSVLGELRAYHAESADVAWIREQVTAYMSAWLNEYYPIPGRCWHVLKVRQMGGLDSYHRCFENYFPRAHEIRLVVFSNCGRERYRLDVVSFDADRLGAQIEVVPIVTYVGCEMGV
jgi:hypothetical protein